MLPRRRWLRGRYLRTSSNRYVIGVPDRAVVPGQRPPWLRRASTGQSGQRQESVSKQEALDEMLRAAATAGDGRARRPGSGHVISDKRKGLIAMNLRNRWDRRRWLINNSQMAGHVTGRIEAFSACARWLTGLNAAGLIASVALMIAA